MPTPAQMCCAIGLCCPPGSAAQRSAWGEILREHRSAAAGPEGEAALEKLIDELCVDCGALALVAPKQRTLGQLSGLLRPILASASKISFLMLAATACAGFLVGQLPVRDFVVLVAMAFTYYFSSKGDPAKPYGGK